VCSWKLRRGFCAGGSPVSHSCAGQVRVGGCELQVAHTRNVRVRGEGVGTLMEPSPDEERRWRSLFSLQVQSYSPSGATVWI
jgi:hypothetical protein